MFSKFLKNGRRWWGSWNFYQKREEGFGLHFPTLMTYDMCNILMLFTMYNCVIVLSSISVILNNLLILYLYNSTCFLRCNKPYNSAMCCKMALMNWNWSISLLVNVCAPNTTYIQNTMQHLHVCSECVCISRGPLVVEVGYHPRKKIHVIRVVFRTRQCTRVHHLGVQKRAKLGKKGVFLVI